MCCICSSLLCYFTLFYCVSFIVSFMFFDQPRCTKQPVRFFGLTLHVDLLKSFWRPTMFAPFGQPCLAQEVIVNDNALTTNPQPPGTHDAIHIYTYIDFYACGQAYLGSHELLHTNRWRTNCPVWTDFLEQPPRTRSPLQPWFVRSAGASQLGGLMTGPARFCNDVALRTLDEKGVAPNIAQPFCK